jgi:rhomboid-like protein
MIDFRNIPVVTKNLLIANIVAFVATSMFPNLETQFSLYMFHAPQFEPYQILTHMFIHADFRHLFFNMFALYMFGSAIEHRLGDKKYLTYYLLTGLGAIVLHSITQHYEYIDLFNKLDYMFKNGDLSYQDYTDQFQNAYTRGASGAVFGLLIAFAMFYPNERLQLLFFPQPIKAIYFVSIIGLYEVYSGFQNAPDDSVAHFAHLGGALFGWITINIWRKKNII